MKHHTRLVAVVSAIVAIAGIGATSASAATANGVDKAFVAEMPMHHEMAIEMAEMALDQAEHGEIKTTARKIIKAQRAEIGRLTTIAQGLGVTPVDGHDHMAMMAGLETLGLTMKQAGMDMDMGMLEGAKPFDRTFIEMMVPHHLGAIRMARIELRRGKDAELRTIARAIVSAQAREIQQMKRWYAAWYGSPSAGAGM